MSWRYLAFSEPDGVVLGEVPLTGVELTRVSSGPGWLTGTIPWGRVPDWLDPWACSIYAEDASRRIRGGGFLTPVSESAGGVAVRCVGRSGYPQGMPWTADPYSGVKVDPLDIVRRVWAHLQAQPQGDVRVVVDPTTTPPGVWVGEPERDVAFTTGAGEDVAFTTGPFTLDWWSTTDLGRVIDDLAARTPFEYLEHTQWAEDGASLVHRLRLGYPTLGSRRSDLRFEIGVNVTITPEESAEQDAYVSEAHLLGSGTGSTMVRATLTRPTSGVRRVLVMADNSARSKTALEQTARAELAWRTGTPRISELALIEHPFAPLSALEVGDEIRVIGTDHGDQPTDRWARIVSIKTSPATDTAAVEVVEV